MSGTRYPSQIDGYPQLPLVRDGIDNILADDINRIRNAAVAIQQELGVNPSSTYGTVKARLDALELSGIGISILNTKGDLLTSDGDSLTNLSIGPDGYVLTADSTVAKGLAWKASTGTSTNTSISSSIFTLATNARNSSEVQSIIGGISFAGEEYESKAFVSMGSVSDGYLTCNISLYNLTDSTNIVTHNHVSATTTKVSSDITISDNEKIYEVRLSLTDGADESDHAICTWAGIEVS